jgi:hypothetical protein
MVVSSIEELRSRDAMASLFILRNKLVYLKLKIWRFSGFESENGGYVKGKELR